MGIFLPLNYIYHFADPAKDRFLFPVLDILLKNFEKIFWPGRNRFLLTCSVGINLSNPDLIFLENMISGGELVEGVFGFSVPCAFLRDLFSVSTNLSVWPTNLGWYFLFFLQAGRVFSFSSTLNSCVSVVEFSLWWPKLLIYWPHSLKRSIQWVPNRF